MKAAAVNHLNVKKKYLKHLAKRGKKYTVLVLRTLAFLMETANF